MSISRSLLILLVLFCFACPNIGICQEPASSKSDCTYCGVFKKFIVDAQANGDTFSLEKLKNDLPRMSSLSDREREHIGRLVSDAMNAMKSDSTEPNAVVRETRRVETTPLGEIAFLEERSELAATLFANPEETRDAFEGIIADDTVLDLANVPQGDNQYDHCQRVILFALPRRDTTAVENLSGKIADMTELSFKQREHINAMISSFRSQTSDTSGTPILMDVAPTPMFALDETETETAESEITALVDAEPATGDSNQSLALTTAAADLFSQKYVRIRQRYLDFFLFGGMSATELNVNLTNGELVLTEEAVTKATFADQTLHMGQALLTFAGEARLLKAKGVSTTATEKTIAILLDAFDELDAADQYGASKRGFFVRDVVSGKVSGKNCRGIPDAWDIKSDMTAEEATDNAMSIDQATSLFVGWWAVTKWSTSPKNVDHAKKQIHSVMEFLIDSKFLIRLPDGGPVPRGPDFRAAAGFFCHITGQATGSHYFTRAKIELAEIKGDPIRFRDDNLGEFEIPGYRIPIDLPVAVSHPAVLALTPAGLLAMSSPPKIAIRFSDLFPDADKNIQLPCAHMEQAHPSGDTVNLPCAHFTAPHPGGHPGPVLACAHMVQSHPGGDKGPCLHMTARHPGGDSGPPLPCIHRCKLHDYHWVKVGPVKTKVPCTHYGKCHPGGHRISIPCIHIVPEHAGGHTVPCVHMKQAHPSGHPQTLPCVCPPVQQHPAGHDKIITCVHFEQAHPSGHGFDLTKLDIEIPIGDVQSYDRHIILQCLAFEPLFNGTTTILPAAVGSNHSWSALLRLQAQGDMPRTVLRAKALIDLEALTETNLSNLTPIPWAKTNRWERCTDLEPDSGGPYAHNGLDYLSLEILQRLSE